MIYYYFICQRKLWYFANEINMEQNSELVSIGKTIDETSYKREKKSILIDNTINIDFIKDGAVLHEVKKTKAIEEAGIWQLKYYMYYLKQKGVETLEAKIDYPLLRQTKEIVLEKEDVEIIENVIKNIQEIVTKENPPEVLNEKICKKCSYYDLCYV
ncbi:MAG: CRISPR-associated protein Cas4 [Clostridia bacterium]|nr:CRISPR-associated protein Cas4 [Clostridia bacterium]